MKATRDRQTYTTAATRYEGDLFPKHDSPEYRVAERAVKAIDCLDFIDRSRPLTYNAASNPKMEADGVWWLPRSSKP